MPARMWVKVESLHRQYSQVKVVHWQPITAAIARLARQPNFEVSFGDEQFGDRAGTFSFNPRIPRWFHGRAPCISALPTKSSERLSVVGLGKAPSHKESPQLLPYFPCIGITRAASRARVELP